MSSETGTRSFLSASISIAAVRIVGRGAAFAAALMGSRNLGPVEFGAYVYVLTFLTAINLVGGMGLEQLALIHLGRARAQGSTVVLDQVLSLLGRRAAIVLPVASFVFVIPIYGVLGSSTALLCVGATGVCLTAIIMAGGILRGLDRPLASSVVQESGRGPVFLLGAAVLYLGGGMAEVWTATLLFATVFAAGAAVTAVRAARQVRSGFSDASVSVNLNDGGGAVAGQFRFLLILMATNSFLWVCPVILKRDAGLTEVGLFNVAMQFPALVSFLSTSLETMYVPKIAALWHGGRLHDMRPLLRTGSRLTLLAGVPVVLILAVFAGPLLSLYGKAYSAGVPAMLVIVAAQAVSVFCGPCGYLVLLTGRERLNLAGMAAGAVSGVICLLALVPSYGHMAAALAFLVATAVPNVWFSIYCVKRLGINPTLLAAFQASPSDAGTQEHSGPLAPTVSGDTRHGRLPGATFSFLKGLGRIAEKAAQTK